MTDLLPQTDVAAATGYTTRWIRQLDSVLEPVVVAGRRVYPQSRVDFVAGYRLARTR